MKTFRGLMVHLGALLVVLGMAVGKAPLHVAVAVVILAAIYEVLSERE